MTDTNTAQMVVDLRATGDAVRAKGWVAPGLGVPGAPLGLLGSSSNPLSGLAAAGLGWFMPLVSFLGEPLTQLQGGDGASVASTAEDFAGAGRDLGGVADAYRESTSAQTSAWSGQAAGEYRAAGAQHADGVAGLGAASSTTGDAIIGAGQVVAQAIAEVTQLVAEAVAQIVPIMTQAVARAGETFGQSVVEAIPPCVGIAVEYALRIAAKLAALLASGDNLLKLVQGGMAVVTLINQALSTISRQSMAADASAQAGPGTVAAGAAVEVGPEAFTASGNVQGSAPMSASGGGPVLSGRDGVEGTVSRTSSTPSTTTYSSGYTPQPHVAAPDTPRPQVQTGGSGGVTGTGLPIGVHSGGRGPSARNGSGVRVGGGRGADTANQESRQQRGGGAQTLGAMPMGAMGGMRPGDADKEHERKVPLVEDEHDEVFAIDRVLPEDLEHEVPAAEPVPENSDDEYFTNPPEITR
jgi:hypothetical protein